MAPVARVTIVISDPLSADGLAILEQAGCFDLVHVDGADRDALRAALRDARALLVRSGTKVTDEVMGWAPGLMLVGRAGTGVDNIDMEAASRRGIVAMNTPDANSIAAAEQTLALLMALMRNIVPAANSLAAGRWDRSAFLGAELAGKTLGIVGFGRIGREVARRARAFDMTLLAYDPFVSEDLARQCEARLTPLDELFALSDIVTLHLPVTKTTRHLVDAKRLAGMKRGARLINCARGGLVDEAALHQALESGHLAGAALDVFEQEPPGDSPLPGRRDVVATPHLGASTREAQQNVSIELARQVRDYFLTGAVRNAVNIPSLSAEAYEQVAPWLDLVERLGRLAASLARGPIRKIRVDYRGEMAGLPLPPVTLAAVKGCLTPAAQESVNFVNARLMAAEKGIDVEETMNSRAEDFTSLVDLTVIAAETSCRVTGTVLSGGPRIVAMDGYQLDAPPAGPLLVLENSDVPGVVGFIGTLLGNAGVNIARINWGRDGARGTALTVIHVDATPNEALMATMRADPRVQRAESVGLPEAAGRRPAAG